MHLKYIIYFLCYINFNYSMQQTSKDIFWPYQQHYSSLLPNPTNTYFDGHNYLNEGNQKLALQHLQEAYYQSWGQETKKITHQQCWHSLKKLARTDIDSCTQVAVISFKDKNHKYIQKKPLWLWYSKKLIKTAIKNTDPSLITLLEQQGLLQYIESKVTTCQPAALVAAYGYTSGYGFVQSSQKSYQLLHNLLQNSHHDYAIKETLKALTYFQQQYPSYSFNILNDFIQHHHKNTKEYTHSLLKEVTQKLTHDSNYQQYFAHFVKNTKNLTLKNIHPAFDIALKNVALQEGRFDDEAFFLLTNMINQYKKSKNDIYCYALRSLIGYVNTLFSVSSDIEQKTKDLYRWLYFLTTLPNEETQKLLSSIILDLTSQIVEQNQNSLMDRFDLATPLKYLINHKIAIPEVYFALGSHEIGQSIHNITGKTIDINRYAQSIELFEHALNLPDTRLILNRGYDRLAYEYEDTNEPDLAYNALQKAIKYKENSHITTNSDIRLCVHDLRRPTLTLAILNQTISTLKKALNDKSSLTTPEARKHAAAMLAELYFTGSIIGMVNQITIPLNLREAYYYAKVGAELNDEHCFIILANLYQSGIKGYLKVDKEKSFNTLELGVSKTNSRDLFISLLKTSFITEKYEKIWQLSQQDILKNHYLTKFMMSYLYTEGISPTTNFKLSKQHRNLAKAMKEFQDGLKFMPRLFMVSDYQLLLNILANIHSTFVSVEKKSSSVEKKLLQGYIKFMSDQIKQSGLDIKFEELESHEKK